MLLTLAIIALVLFLVVAGRRLRGNLLPVLMAALAVSCTISMVLFPAAAFEAAVRGMQLWWDIVFPALLPFFIGAELLIGLGVIHFMGVLLEPMMRPVFRVPGHGSFVMAVGLASGFPIGSVLTARLRRENLCTKAEAERLMSFTNTADPLFMSGAVAVGMFGRPDLAVIIMVAHYLSSLSIGLLLRFHAPHAPQTPSAPAGSGHLLRRALRALLQAKKKDARPIGRLMGDAVRNSINTLLLVGGFIIMFSVIIRMLTNIGAIDLMVSAIGVVLTPLGFSSDALLALTTGVFEITLGTQLSSQIEGSLVQSMMVAGAIIAWSGLSVHAQVAAITHDTDISMTPFMVARFGHAILAALYTLLLMQNHHVVTMAGQIPVPQLTHPLAVAWISTKTMLLIAAGLTIGPLLWYLPRHCIRFIHRNTL